MMPWRRVSVAAVIFVTCLTVLDVVLDVAVDWAWFSELGYLEVFWTVFGTRAWLFVTVFAASAIIVWFNGWLAFRLTGAPIGRSLELAGVTGPAPRPASVPDVVRTRLRLFIVGAALIGGGLLATGEMANWDGLLRFLYQLPYGQRDPVFEKDLSFYLFSLPAYVALKNWIMLTLGLAALGAGAVYWVRGHIEFESHRRRMSPTAIAHGSALLGVFFVVKTWSYGLDRYLLLYGDNGVVVGASYTDLHIELPILWILIGLAVLASIGAWANLWTSTYKLPVTAAVLVFGTAFVLAEV